MLPKHHRIRRQPVVPAAGEWKDQNRIETWIWLPLISLVMAFGLVLVAAAFRGSVSGTGSPDWVYWLGLMLLVGPAAARLGSASAPRSERLALVLALGLGLYLVKVMHSPVAFTYTDELVHAANAEQALRTGRLFGENSILRVTPDFPGLTAATTAIASLAGLSVFTSGLVVIGAARLLITLGLFLIYEKISGSELLAGLGTVFYMANSNYLYWSAQYAYESLALPLLVFVIFALLVRQHPLDRRAAQPAILTAVLGILAVTITHHLASYAMVALLGLAALISLFMRVETNKTRLGLGVLAFFALVTVLFWNVLIAPGVYDYLFPVLRDATGAGISLMAGGGEESGRALFESSGSDSASFLERLVAFTSALLTMAVVPVGLWVFLRRLRWWTLAWVFALASLVYFPLQVLRLTGAGWEIANRASEYFYLGVAFVIALALIIPLLNHSNVILPVIVMLVTGLLFAGGVIAGWPPSLLLSRAYIVLAEGPDGEQLAIKPQGVAAAEWAAAYLGPGNRMAADNSSARLMQAYGDQYALAGDEFGIRNLFRNETIGRGEIEVIQRTGVEYLVSTRPLDRWERMWGVYYNPAEGLENANELLFPELIEKYDQAVGVDRLLDTGLVVIYKIGDLADAAAQP